MRSGYFILATYVFALALLPCNDPEISLDKGSYVIGIVDGLNHPHSGKELDICTPFCICTCCAAHIRLSVAGVMIAGQPSHNTRFETQYFERPVTSIGQSIWQPPRA